MRTCFQSQTRLQAFLPFPSLPIPHHSMPPPFWAVDCGCGWGWGEFCVLWNNYESHSQSEKQKQKQNKTKNQLESSRVELSWTTRSEFEFNAKWPSSWPSWPTRLVAHSRLLQRCCVARWPARCCCCQCTSHAHSGLSDTESPNKCLPAHSINVNNL